ncbi:hypothetical protein ACS0TY_008149 [Phlomoides rotata]
MATSSPSPNAAAAAAPWSRCRPLPPDRRPFNDFSDEALSQARGHGGEDLSETKTFHCRRRLTPEAGTVKTNDFCKFYA